jgi:hypothetical protein
VTPEARRDIEKLVEVRKDLDENEAVTGSHPHAFPVTAETRLVPLGQNRGVGENRQRREPTQRN